MLQKLNRKAHLFIFIGAFLLICGCNPRPPSRPTLDPNIIDTIAAKTVQAQLGETVIALPPTATQPLATKAPTLTPTIAIEVSPTVTNTPLPTLRLTPGTTAITYAVKSIPTFADTSTSVPKPVGDLGIPIDHDPANGTIMQKNQEFDTTWTFKNIGTTTWNSNYYLTFFGGSRIGKGDTNYFLPREVKPNETSSITVKMVAPDRSGSFTSVWFMMNEQNKAFMELNLIINVP